MYSFTRNVKLNRRMNLLFIGCSHLSGSWDNPYQVDIRTGIIVELARRYPQHQFDVHAAPGHGLFTFQQMLSRVSNYDRIVFVGDYNRLSLPADPKEPELLREYQSENFSIHEYRTMQFYTIFPPNCLDPKPYTGDYRNLIAQFDDTYMDRKTRLLVHLLEEQLAIPCIDWLDIWRDMERDGLDVPAYWTHPTDRHFSLAGNKAALPYLEARLKGVQIL